jgi:omega-6 fatty acid desaturase (delta-12 desaturase)
MIRPPEAGRRPPNPQLAFREPFMRTAGELVRATHPFAREVRWRSWWHFWSTLAILTGLLSLTCLDVDWWWRLPASVLAGLTVVRMFTIYHDHQHGTILRGSRLADVLLGAFGLLLLTPPSIWRRTHHYHHSHNGRLQAAGVGSFRVMTTGAYARASRRRRLGYALSRHPLTILAGYVTLFLYGMCLAPFLLRPRQHADGAVALLVHAALVATLAVFAPALLLWTLLLPLALAMALGTYLFYAQHNFPAARFQEKGAWDFADAALAGSSFMVMGPVMRWFTGNIGFHHVHHLNARIPFYRLPEAMAHLEELQSPSSTSLSPLAVYRCLRLKLWDPGRQRLVDFAGR